MVSGCLNVSATVFAFCLAIGAGSSGRAVSVTARRAPDFAGAGEYTVRRRKGKLFAPFLGATQPSF